MLDQCPKSPSECQAPTWPAWLPQLLMGIALLPLYLARDEVATGRLRQALPDTYRPSAAYYLLNARGQGKVRKILRFKDWLLEEVRSGLHMGEH